MAAAIPSMSRAPARKRRACGADRLHRKSPKKGERETMKQLRIGDVTIDAVIEREGPWRRPQDFFPAYDEAVFMHHLKTMEPEFFDAASGLMVNTYQTFL